MTWKTFNHLEDEDFADDIALLSRSCKDMQEKTTQIEMHAKTVELKIEHSKSKKSMENKLGGFEGRCLRRKLSIRWEHSVTNKRIAERIGGVPIVEEVKTRRWRWLGHVFRMDKNRHPFVALTWNPHGKRSRGRGQWTMKDQGLTKHGMS
ncbi:hypothetical protein ElyMa_002900800 [Elysia marginata]|uniref:Reverse transcriptase domain-containing protein n=1 Tax=Elysia marginata TaxID=1093978 RepID=A0AAV4I0D5_9GAST|nr:hypothetical protein ElyMa_002900800 [Elysia marginata]